MFPKSSTPSSKSSSSWIRGVNIAGWLLAERFVTPFLFALNSCQLQGNWCYYENQLGAPPLSSRYHKYCDLWACQPHSIGVPMEDGTVHQDYPIDENSLLASFSSKALAKEYMTSHWENFITKEDVQVLAESAGVEYVKVPIPFYAMSDIRDGEHWVDGQWLYFIRFVGWARQYGIKVWVDMHTPFGNHTNFETSGGSSSSKCEHWIQSAENVKRSMDGIKDLARAIMDDNLRDVVTGFGILNEPYAGCSSEKIKKYSNDALKAIREIMGHDTAVYVSDSFGAAVWNDVGWTDPSIYNNTYIGSNYFHIFSESGRASSPKQHIEHTCEQLGDEMVGCCYKDHPKNKQVSDGVSRIVGEWSAGYDTLPSEKLNEIMKDIRGQKPRLMDQALSAQKMEFLANHVKSQMVTYESVDTGVSSGWFFWTLKMEGSEFVEWDFTRGMKEGWIPKMPQNQTDSLSIFGSCDNIKAKTKDSIDDGLVVSDGKTMRSSATNTRGKISGQYQSSQAMNIDEEKKKPKKSHWFHLFAVCFFGYGIWTVFLKNEFGFGRERSGYNSLHRTGLSI